jgi:membrane protein YdbS with pleckstrin-like domain
LFCQIIEAPNEDPKEAQMTIFVLIVLMSGLVIYAVYEGKNYSQATSQAPIDIKAFFKTKTLFKYITPETLLEGEKIIFVPKPHWLVIIKPLRVFLVLLILSLLQRALFGRGSFLYYIPGFSSLSGIIPAATFITVIYSILVILDYKNSEYCITDKRIIVKRGILRRVSIDISMGMIETIIFHQGLIGRIFKYGTVAVTGIGASLSGFSYIYDPVPVRTIIINEVHKRRS